MNSLQTEPRVSASRMLVIALPVIASIGWIDYATGPVAMSLIYFVPIVITAWASSLTAAITVALAAGAAWLAAALASSSFETRILYWNFLTRTLTFVMFGVMVNLVRQDRDVIAEKNAQLNAALELEKKVSRTDPLTGLPNSRSFKEALDRELARGHREEIAIGLGYVDLDNFKRINDNLGHDTGDEVLRRVGDALRRSVRAEDIAARLGGDEFAILGVRATEEGLASIGTRLVDEIRTIASDYEGLAFGCTIGFVLFPRAPHDPVAVVREADELMYEVKERSKGSFEVRVSESPSA